MIFENSIRKLANQILMYRDGYLRVVHYKSEFNRFISHDHTYLSSYCHQQLRQMIIFANEFSAYYREQFKNIGLDINKIAIPHDISTLPFLNKKIIEKHIESIISDRFNPNDLELSYTGGTSGIHNSFYRDLKCRSVRQGRQIGILERCGYSRGDRCGLIWGVESEVVNSNSRRNIKLKFRKFASGLESLSCAVLNPTKLSEFHKRLLKFKPQVLYGYPNAMAHFASFIKENRLPSIKVKTIISTAERLTKKHRVLLSKVFKGEVFDLYCTREHGCIGFECKEHNGYHVDIGNVYVEIVSKDRAVQPGETGEIVVTDLLNFGMPFIRYHIGDRGRFSTAPCKCGCALPLLQRLDGRETELVYRPDGSAVTVMDILMDVPEIDAIQVVQEKLDEIDLLMVVSDNYSEGTKQKAMFEMQKQVGPQIRVNLKIVPEIPSNPVSGKFQEVISKINIAEIRS